MPRLAYQSTRSRVENFKPSWWTTEAWSQKRWPFFCLEKLQTTQSIYLKHYFRVSEFCFLRKFCIWSFVVGADRFLTSSHPMIFCHLFPHVLECVGSEIFGKFDQVLFWRPFPPLLRPFEKKNENRNIYNIYIYIYVLYTYQVIHVVISSYFQSCDVWDSSQWMVQVNWCPKVLVCATGHHPQGKRIRPHPGVVRRCLRFFSLAAQNTQQKGFYLNVRWFSQIFGWFLTLKFWERFCHPF